MTDLIDTLLTGGVAVALIGVASQVLMWWLNNNKPKSEEKEGNVVPLDKFDDQIEVQQIMERALNKTGAERFLIMKTENGGGKPRLGSHLYASVIYEAIREPLETVKEDYQRLLVDDIYVKMLSDIGLNHPNKLVVSEMKDGLLKRIYLKEGISYSEVHYLMETDNAFFYASVATNKKDDTFDDPIDRVEIEIALSKITNIFTDIANSN